MGILVCGAALIAVPVPAALAVSGGIASDVGKASASALSEDKLIPNPADSSHKARFESFLENGCGSACLIYPVNIVEITAKPGRSLRAADYRSAIENVVALLNRDFRLENGKSLFHFELKNYQRYPSTFELSRLSSGCKKLVQLGDKDQEYDTDEEGRPYVWKEYLQGCGDFRYHDPKALNVYIYDSYTAANGDADTDGHGNYNWSYDYHGYLFLDYERVKSGYDGTENYRAEAHEVGHALGLDHVCELGASTGSSETNLMASARGSVAIQLPLNKNHIEPSSRSPSEFSTFDYDCPSGTQGNRRKGLTPAQAFTVLLYANKHIGRNSSAGGSAGGWLPHEYKLWPAVSTLSSPSTISPTGGR